VTAAFVGTELANRSTLDDIGDLHPIQRRVDEFAGPVPMPDRHAIGPRPNTRSHANDAATVKPKNWTPRRSDSHRFVVTDKFTERSMRNRQNH
jgi:hypothetical protein